MSETTDFVLLMSNTFTPIKRISLFKKASREEKYAYLFDKNRLPTMEAWYVSGEILIWGLWLFWLLFNAVIWLIGGAPDLVIDYLLIRGDLLDYNWGMVETFLIFIIGCVILYFLTMLMLVFATFLYPVVSPVILLANKTQKIVPFWFILGCWAVLCFSLSVWIGKPIFKVVEVDGEFDLVFTTWLDWINPDHNSLMLIVGYPVLLFIAGGALIINTLYHKYKPIGDKNWSAEGLDSHLLDGDADN